MNPEALILRRCYPVPVTFADLRAAVLSEPRPMHRLPWGRSDAKRWWSSALKQVTGAIDEVYAVVDGREVRVGRALGDSMIVIEMAGLRTAGENLLDKADRAGYWERPHEVRLDLSPRPVSHGEVARAVLVGQEALERGGVVRS
jgi:hypothetical protein